MDDQTPPPTPTGAAFVPSEPIAAAGQPWGFWATVGWSVAIAVVYFIVQILVVVFFVMARHGKADLPGLTQDGSVLAVSTIAGAPVVAGACLLIARLRKGIGLSEYLGLSWPGGRALRRWLIGLIALGATFDLITFLVGKSWVPEVMVELYQNTQALWLLWIALVVAAPLGEETFFRGFLLPGLRASRLGQLGSVLVSSAAWAAIHLQYDFYGIAQIFFLGILLGYARLKTGSLWLCMIMHGVLNLISTIQMELYLATTRVP